jgi:hypothetical protein
MLFAACRGETRGGGEAVPDSAAASREVAAVRARYQSSDMAATGAWIWIGPDSTVFILIDAQSTVQDMVQARADLWMAFDTAAQQIGRSDVMPSAAEFGAYAFQDLTGDGLPDLFGYVADSAGVSYPVFLVGARGAMTEELVGAAPGWRFSTGDEHLPLILTGPGGACALQLWADEPVPDAQGEGWRYLSLVRLGPLGPLGPPEREKPACGGEAAGTGVQSNPAVP